MFNTVTNTWLKSGNSLYSLVPYGFTVSLLGTTEWLSVQIPNREAQESCLIISEQIIIFPQLLYLIWECGIKDIHFEE